jgi:integrase
MHELNRSAELFRTLGHVNTAMVYRTYGRYIPNLTRHDGSEFERRYTDAVNNEKKSLDTIRNNFRHNLQKSEEKEV